MSKSIPWVVAASIAVASFGLAGSTVTAGAAAANGPHKVKAGERHLGGKMPLPVDQTFDRENSPSDKLVVEVTHSAPESSHYVAYVKIVWGDLDNLIKGTGKQYYSNWDGSLALNSATGAVDEKIQFDDKTGKHKSVAVKPERTPKHLVNDKNRRIDGPHEGSGRDALVTGSGPTLEWKAGVVGVLDGLRIKITSDSPNISANLTAGKFQIPLTITPESATAAPAASSTPAAIRK